MTGDRPTLARPTTPGMRKMLVIAAVLVLIIGLPTYVWAENTDTLFSWTVNPPLTAAFLGAGYLAAMVVEYLASRQREWANARIAVPAVLLFTALTTIVTLRHLDKFHFGAEFSVFTQAVTWVWLIVYVVVPPVLAFLWFSQTRVAGEDPPRVAPIPNVMRLVCGAQALVMIGIGVALTLAPVSVAEAIWPWTLSALTGGAVGAWLLGVGVGVAHLVGENDLGRVLVWMRAYVLYGVLVLIAVFRFATAPDGSAVIDWSGFRIWAFLAVVASIIAVAGWALAITPAHRPSPDSSTG
jgi:hypothetical protein